MQCHKELEDLADSFGILHATAKTMPTALAIPTNIEILFLLSVPGPFKSALLRNAKLLIYTPTNEHFGIVPVEAMQNGVPVLAANTGGPLETVVDGKTGWLRDVKDIYSWTEVMRIVIDDDNAEEMQTMGDIGKQRAEIEFSHSKMSHRFEEEIREMLKAERRPFFEWKDLMLGLGVIGIFMAAFVSTIVSAPGDSSRQSTKLNT